MLLNTPDNASMFLFGEEEKGINILKKLTQTSWQWKLVWA